MSAMSVCLIILLLGVLTLASYVARLYSEAGKFLSREFQNNIELFENQIEPRLKVSRWRAALSMAVLEQIGHRGHHPAAGHLGLSRALELRARSRSYAC